MVANAPASSKLKSVSIAVLTGFAGTHLSNAEPDRVAATAQA
jgi:hypothetical protein